MLSKIVLMILAMLQYTRNQRQNRFQKLFAIYFKFRGLTAKGFDTLHALALTMSHKWTCESIGRMSERAMAEALALAAIFPWLLSYDNVNIPFRVFSQRIDNQGDIGAGSAATIYIKRGARPLPKTANMELQEIRKQGMRHPLNALEIFDLGTKSYPRIHQETKYQVLQFLLDCPQFDCGTYKDKDSPLLARPPPVCLLPSGPKNITLQFLLGTVDIPEASYEDNSRLIDEWLQQLGLNSPEMKQRLGMDTLLAWCGDQLTISRLRNLMRFRGEDLNSYDRLDWLLLPFGWLHFMMAYASGLHKQYLGTSKGRGLSHAFDLLTKKGLGVALVKGPFHHDLSEVIYHSAEAHIREEWLLQAKVESLDQLRLFTPEQLVKLADTIVEKWASTHAIEEMDRLPERQKDEVLIQTMMCTRDFLQFIVLNEAIKRGDVGLMEDFLPHMLFRFIGGSNSNYAIEVLEVLQGIHREWSPDVKCVFFFFIQFELRLTFCSRDFILENCWLINNTGKPDGFLPVDQAQEANIKDIKVTYRSEGPGVDWLYLKKLHPAIHVIRAVGSHVEKEFNTSTRGKKHTVPEKELDIQRLWNSYCASKLHKTIPGRKRFSAKDYEKDFTSSGALSFSDGKLLERWISERNVERSTKQEWYTEESSGSEMSE
jgi:hypothetical protein